MAAHRYWRAAALEAYGAGDLELSEFHLLSAGTRVDASATLTANTVPDVSGVLANLKDDVLTTAARWSANAVKSLVLSWDFGGTPADITDIRLAGDSNSRFPLIVAMQWSDNGSTWAVHDTFSGIKWPGAQTKTISKSVLKGRYFRIYITANNGDAYTSMQEIELRALASGPDLTSPSTPSNQSSFFPNDYNTAAKLVDNDLSDYAKSTWVTATGAVLPQWVSFDFGVSTTLLELAIWPQNLTAILARAPKDFQIQVSEDGVLWTTAVSFTNITGWVAGTAKTFALVSTLTLIETNIVRGRSAPLDVSVLGLGPVISYGTTANVPLLHLGVETGSVKDTTSGVLGQGIGRVRGTVKETGMPNSPVFRRVRLIRERDGMLMREVWSDKVTGAYDFTYIDELQTWTVVSYDHLHNYRAVVADNLTLANGGVEMMP